jgi:hypothetical protein
MRDVRTIETKPMDVSELKQCRVCERGAAAGGPVFYEVTLTQCVVDPNVHRMAGMEQFFGGNVGLARVMMDSNTVAQRLPPQRHIFCAECAMKPIPPIFLLEDE